MEMMVLAPRETDTADEPEMLEDRLEHYGSAFNFLARELFREATLLRSRRQEAERKARYRAGKRTQGNGPALSREDRLTG
jgi:hypothetical protein